MAKQADNSIPEPIEWLDQFDEFPMEDIIPELQDMLLASFSSAKKKNQATAATATTTQ